MTKKRRRTQHEETLASIPEEEITQEMRIFQPARLHFIELYEEEYLDHLKTHFKHYGFRLKSTILIADGSSVRNRSKKMTRPLPFIPCKK